MNQQQNCGLSETWQIALLVYSPRKSEQSTLFELFLNLDISPTSSSQSQGSESTRGHAWVDSASPTLWGWSTTWSGYACMWYPSSAYGGNYWQLRNVSGESYPNWNGWAWNNYYCLPYDQTTLMTLASGSNDKSRSIKVFFLVKSEYILK